MLFLLFTRAQLFLSFFFFNDTATTEIYTLSLHDALPISKAPDTISNPLIWLQPARPARKLRTYSIVCMTTQRFSRSEEHTSELQSLAYLVCRLLLEKKKEKIFLHVRHHHAAPALDGTSLY